MITVCVKCNSSLGKGIAKCPQCGAVYLENIQRNQPEISPQNESDFTSDSSNPSMKAVSFFASSPMKPAVESQTQQKYQEHDESDRPIPINKINKKTNRDEMLEFRPIKQDPMNHRHRESDATIESRIVEHLESKYRFWKWLASGTFVLTLIFGFYTVNVASRSETMLKILSYERLNDDQVNMKHALERTENAKTIFLKKIMPAFNELFSELEQVRMRLDHPKFQLQEAIQQQKPSESQRQK